MEQKKKLEISGNLICILNYQNFQNTIVKVYSRFVGLLGYEIMTRIPLFIDNATSGSGYTPIITPILGEYLCIKLNIDNFLDSSRIIFQFSHELCHYVFYSLKGLNKPIADEFEETVCAAMSLCILSELTRELPVYINYVSNLQNKGYRNGVCLAAKVQFKSEAICEQILMNV